MRNYILIAAVLGLAACQPQTTEPNTNSNIAVNSAATDCGLASDTVLDEKALFAAETAYNIPANAYVSLGDRLTADRKAQAKAALISAYDYLKLARAAYAAGDGCKLKQFSDLAQAFGNRAKASIPVS